MKKLMLLSAFLVACGTREEPATDTAAMAAGPAALTPADIAGTWNGMTMAEGSDSVLARWTVTSASGMDSKAWVEGSTDTVTYTHTFDADSFVANSSVYADQTLPGNPKSRTAR